jgi:RNase P subunit RPR2
MECPECKKQLRIPTNTQLNMESHHKTVKTITECCGKLVMTYPVFSYGAYKYSGDDTEDDWGRKAK